MVLPVLSRDNSASHTDIARWDPFRELGDLHSRMWNLMDSGWAEPAGTSWVPPVDVEETDEAFLVEVELPGVARDAVDIELRRRELRVKGERVTRERVGVWRRRNRLSGAFDYRMTLTSDVDADRVEAQMRDGVLRIMVPKAEAAKPRKIAISEG